MTCFKRVNANRASSKSCMVFISIENLELFNREFLAFSDSLITLFSFQIVRSLSWPFLSRDFDFRSDSMTSELCFDSSSPCGRVRNPELPVSFSSFSFLCLLTVSSESSFFGCFSRLSVVPVPSEGKFPSYK